MTTVATAPPTGRGIPQPGMSLAELRPDLAAEWSPLNSFGPERVGASSNIKVWWTCEHHPDIPYAASVANRSQRASSGCGCQTGHRLIKGVNDLASQYPEIAMEWSPSNDISPDEITTMNNRVVKWICDKHPQYPYEMSVFNRTYNKGQCTCTNTIGRRKAIRGVNDLLTVMPEKAKIWHPSNKRQPHQVTISSPERVAWICDEHLNVPYYATVHDITSGRLSCPCKLTGAGARQILKGVNDLATKNRTVAVEWHPTLNKVAADEVTPSSKRKVWWECQVDASHKPWQARVYSRAHGGSGCPTCSKYGQSRLETAFRERLAQGTVLTDVIMDPHAKLPLKWAHGNHYKVDILGVLADGRQVVVEYDGKVYHDGTVDSKAPQRDITKTQTLLDNGYIVVRIRENGLADVPLSHPHLLQVQHVAYAATTRDLGDIHATSGLIEGWLEKV